MKTIWKYPLKVAGEQVVEMPEGAKIISAQMQGGQLCLWAIVISCRAVESRRICVFGTGHDISTDRAYEFIDTAQMAGGSLVWHVFEKL